MDAVAVYRYAMAGVVGGGWTAGGEGHSDGRKGRCLLDGRKAGLWVSEGLRLRRGSWDESGSGVRFRLLGWSREKDLGNDEVDCEVGLIAIWRFRRLVFEVGKNRNCREERLKEGYNLESVR